MDAVTLVTLYSLLGGNLLATVGLILKLVLFSKSSSVDTTSNPNHESMDIKLDTIIECGRETNSKLGTISDSVSEIKGKIG